MKQELNNDVGVRTDIEDALKEVQKKVISLVDDFDLPVKYDDAWDAGKIIKSMSLALDGCIEGLSHLDILKRYLRIVGELNISLFHCFSGLNMVLTPEELNIFYKEALQSQIHLICLQHDLTCPIPNQYSYITFIDDDFDEHIISPFGHDPF